MIDGDPEFRDLFSLALRSDKLKIETAVSARGALEALNQGGFDLILMDFRLPDMDGMRLIQEIRQRGHDTKIIVASSIMPAKFVIDAISHGVTSFVNKPSSLTLLRKVVQENLSEKEQNHLKTKAFHLARQLNFGAASRVLEDSQELNSELTTWQQVFRALSRGDEITPYSGDLMEYALIH